MPFGLIRNDSHTGHTEVEGYPSARVGHHWPVPAFVGTELPDGIDRVAVDHAQYLGVADGPVALPERDEVRCSWRHGTHQVAKKFTGTQRPR